MNPPHHSPYGYAALFFVGVLAFAFRASAQTVASVSIGDYSTVFVKTDGTLWAMGATDFGDLDEGTTMIWSTPVAVAGGVASVSAGSDFTMFVKTDGTLWAVGNNDSGQLGDGTTTDRYTPVQVASGVASVSAGSAHTMFVKKDGTLWATGSDGYGQLGDNSTPGGAWYQSTPVQVASGVASVSAGYDHTMFVKTDGTLWAMGNNSDGQLGDGTATFRRIPVQVASGVASVAAGTNHTMFVKTDGTLWAVGCQDFGELGDGSVEPPFTSTYRSTPVQVASGVASVATGYDYTMFVKTDRTLWATGYRGKGVLGDGITGMWRTTPVQVASGVASVAAGFDHTVFVKTDGTLWATGSNDYGQLGDGTATDRSTPEQVSIPASAPPSFSTQPASQAVTVGGAASFTAAADGTPMPTLQWQVSADGGSSWTNLADTAPYSGTATKTLTITGAAIALNGYQYRCLASNGVNPDAVSNAATLTVVSADQAFLQQLFPAVLGRDIDPGALAAYLAAMSGGRTRSQVYGDLIVSPEFAVRQIEPAIRLYYAALARCPDYAGLEDWSNALHAGALTLTGAADQFAGSAEFLLKYGSLDNTGYVQQLYRNVLGREADPAGLTDWVGQLNNGVSRGAILVGFSESPEFQADMADQVEIIRLYDLLLQRMPTDAELQNWLGFLQGCDQTDTLFAQGYPSGMADADYVSLVFQGFLRRAADAGTLSNFGTALTDGTATHASLVNTLLTSTEFTTFIAPVSRLYMAAFRRVPDAGGLDNWVAYVRAGNSLQSTADAFVASPEFQLTYGRLDVTQYVTLLYKNVLGREPDPTGLADWTSQLGSGSTRGQVLVGFSESQEGSALFAPTVRTFLHYFTFLNATPTQPDLDYWKNYLATLDDQIRDDLLADSGLAD
jgi:alpha-tubulin suppressor-like RCC1 family protein